eukprot:UN28591
MYNMAHPFLYNAKIRTILIVTGVIVFLICLISPLPSRRLSGITINNDSTHSLINNSIPKGDHNKKFNTNKNNINNDKYKADILFVGAGLSSSVLCHMHVTLFNKTCVIVEKRDHIGGNLYDFVNEKGVKVSKYGAHLFHTHHERVWRYVQQFTEWTPYFHRVVGLVDDKIIPIPVNIDTVNIMFADQNINSYEEMDEWLDKNQIH